MSTPNSGFLLIADITGYTAYLSASELEHAQDTLSWLLQLLIENTRPPLIISRLAGDAVISYAWQDAVSQGQTFLELIENTYLGFRKAIDRMVLNNTCGCSACVNIATLDLKFFVHYGTFGLQSLGQFNELVGSDVNLIHRLLKNQVTEQTGLRAYTLFTEAALERLGLSELSAGMIAHEETYEHLGTVRVWLQDMVPIYNEKRDLVLVTIPEDQIVLQVSAEIQLPPELVWDYLIQPEYRTLLIGSDRQEVTNRSKGRITTGTVYQCYHGNQVSPHTILEWKPFERMLTEVLMPVPVPGVFVLIEYELMPIESGTRLIQTFSQSRGPTLGRLMADFMVRMSAKAGQRDIAAFKSAIEADFDSRRGAILPTVSIPDETIREVAREVLSGS